MPTRGGLVIAAGAAAAIVIGRAFGLIELFVIGVGCATAIVLALLVVHLRRPHLRLERWIHPAVLTVGDDGRVDVIVHGTGRFSSPPVRLSDTVGTSGVARIAVGALRPGERVAAAYRIPAHRRGVLVLGPLEVERRDLLGLARTTSIGAGATEVMVAPRAVELAMPRLGQGALGRQLLAQARRLGPGDFHSLRDYVAGDELRSIHWRASARSDELKVRQHTTEGIRRCLVVLDRDRKVYDTSLPELDEAFERAIVAAASLAEAGDRAGLATRFVTSGGIDLRGPDVAAATLRLLARVQPGDALGDLARDPGDGLGLVVVITASPTTPAWRAAEQLLDPATVRVGVFTGRAGDDRLAVGATSVETFRLGWNRLAGHDLQRRPVGAVAS
ncbi:MAG: DUF58 domain-containing protein [Ilumatobacteraceae bacterium]|nr:DUF58 domain-containing protein [Ilumatobacteraceae bacterium]